MVAFVFEIDVYGRSMVKSDVDLNCTRHCMSKRLYHDEVNDDIASFCTEGLV